MSVYRLVEFAIEEIISKKAIPIISITVLILICLQVQYSNVQNLYMVYSLPVLDLILNVIIVGFFYLVTNTIMNNDKTSFSIFSVFFTLFSAINVFVVRYHGSPLFPSELANTRTAANVMGEYDYTPDVHIVVIVLFLLVEISLSSFLFNLGKRNVNLFASMCLGLLVYVMVLSPLANNYSAAFNGIYTVKRHGYFPVAVTDVYNYFNPVSKPEGYDASIIEMEHSSVNEGMMTPNIIVIINETFADLNVYCDVYSDIDFMEPFYGIENASYGFSASSMVGGGTNNTEFEVLTSNSMNILNNGAPFNYMKLNNLDSNCVSYFHSLNYKSVAMHCGSSSNYNRTIAYPAMGFDRIILGPDNFDFNKYGNREFLDSDNYEDMGKVYEEEKGLSFNYLLTMQNHGGYEQNDDSFDLVHVTNDFGNLTDDVNEYLTSIYLSAQAFRDLTDFYASVQDPVVILMVGDHMPSFISELETNKSFSSEELEIVRRMVPFVMWSNCGVDFSEVGEYASMTDLLPLMLKSVGMPLTPYYEYILKVHEEVPLRISNGLYIDKNGTIGKYDKDSPYYDLITMYYYMEYNGLKRGSDYIRELFVLKDCLS